MTSPTAPVRRKIHKLGPGTLTIGSVGTMLDMSCQLTNVRISAEGDSEDAEAVLCGDNIPGARNYTWTLAGSLFQDIEKDGVIDFTWKHAGEEVPFKFVPDSGTTAAVTGRTVIDPIEFGGDVNTKNKSDFEWGIVGTPNLTPATTTTT